MTQVLEQEQDAMPETIEATLNYLMDTGEPVFTQTAAPGDLDVRTGGRQDPRRVTIRNGSLYAAHGRRRIAREAQNSRGRPPRAQRLYGVVRPAARA